MDKELIKLAFTLGYQKGCEDLEKAAQGLNALPEEFGGPYVPFEARRAANRAQHIQEQAAASSAPRSAAAPSAAAKRRAPRRAPAVNPKMQQQLQNANAHNIQLAKQMRMYRRAAGRWGRIGRAGIFATALASFLGLHNNANKNRQIAALQNQLARHAPAYYGYAP